MVSRQLQSHNFDKDQIMELKLNRQLVLVLVLVLICDGYDEIQQLVNLHKATVSTNLIQDYVGLPVPLEPRAWSTQGYMEKLTTIPNLIDLIKDPFLILLALEAIPDVINGSQGLSTIGIVRIQLYIAFVNHWFDVSNRQLRSNPWSRGIVTGWSSLKIYEKGLGAKWNNVGRLESVKWESEHDFRTFHRKRFLFHT